MALATSLVVLLYCCATADILTNFYSNASCFSLLWFEHVGNSQVSVYRTICPTLVYIFFLMHSISHFAVMYSSVLSISHYSIISHVYCVLFAIIGSSLYKCNPSLHLTCSKKGELWG